MAQKKAERQPQDPHAQRGKTLASLVQRLRGWVGTDPSRVPELADALVQLTAHRLLGHGYAAAAADAQEAVRRAGELLTANGPIGPYTSLGDAARYVTAVIHLATVQVGLSMPDAAGRMMDSLEDVRGQLRAYGLREQLEAQTAIWALSSRARVVLVSMDVAAANASADAALDRLAESGLRDDPDAAYLAMDVDRLASDCRWAAGRAEDAISYLHAAMERYEDVVGDRFEEPARLSPALAKRLAEPLFGLYRVMADRLAATGDVDLGLVTRRALVDLLRRLAEQLGSRARVQLASALADLAGDLSRADRADEADSAAAEVSMIATQTRTAAQDLERGVASLGSRSPTWPPLSLAASYAATTAAAAGTKPGDPAAYLAEWQRRTAAWLEAERPEAHRLELQRRERARLDAQRREAERVAAQRAAVDRLAAEQTAAAQAERLETERRAAAEEAERIDRKRRRAERIEAHRLEVERREAERREAERLDAEQLEARLRSE